MSTILPEGMSLPEPPKIYSPNEVRIVLESIRENLGKDPTPRLWGRIREQFNEILESCVSPRNEWDADLQREFGVLFEQFRKKYSPPGKYKRLLEIEEAGEETKKKATKGTKHAPKPAPKKTPVPKDDIGAYIPDYLESLSGRLRARVMQECGIDTFRHNSVREALKKIVELKKSGKERDPVKQSRKVDRLVNSIKIEGRIDGKLLYKTVRTQLRLILIGDGLISVKED